MDEIVKVGEEIGPRSEAKQRAEAWRIMAQRYAREITALEQRYIRENISLGGMMLNANYVYVQQHKLGKLPNGPERDLFLVSRYLTHGGYTWGIVTPDGDIICERCVRSQYRSILFATRNPEYRDTQWQCAGIVNLSESEAPGGEPCAHCGELFGFDTH